MSSFFRVGRASAAALLLSVGACKGGSPAARQRPPPAVTVAPVVVRDVAVEIRALALEALGYQVTVTELAGWEHSLKNELILGRKLHGESRSSRERLDALLAAAGVRPKLVRELWGGETQAPPPSA